MVCMFLRADFTLCGPAAGNPSKAEVRTGDFVVKVGPDASIVVLFDPIVSVCTKQTTELIQIKP